MSDVGKMMWRGQQLFDSSEILEVFQYVRWKWSDIGSVEVGGDRELRHERLRDMKMYAVCVC